jgi:bacterioferritin-associated ferredoxin
MPGPEAGIRLSGKSRRTTRGGHATFAIASYSQTEYVRLVTGRRLAEASMYVCVCNALTDRDVRVQAGAGSVAMVYRGCGCQPQCGKCVPLVRQMLREEAAGPTVGVGGEAD